MDNSKRREKVQLRAGYEAQNQGCPQGQMWLPIL